MTVRMHMAITGKNKQADNSSSKNK